MKRALLLGFLLVLSCASFALAAPKFPKFTGYVVDEAHVLPPGIEARLSDKLAAFEARTKGQLVVVTLKTLQGMEIQDYGYQLGRAWGVGQKGKDNGALLIVAPNDHKVGIEVGYGYEGLLTDAATGLIINNIILPSIRDGHVEQGIWKGSDAIIAVLDGVNPADVTMGTGMTPVTPPAPVTATASPGGSELSGTEIFFILIIVVAFCIRYPTLAWIIFSNISVGSYRGGGGRSGGFRGGGGGGFGGGGSSGSW